MANSGAAVIAEEDYWDLRMRVGLGDQGIEGCEDGYARAPFIVACG